MPQTAEPLTVRMTRWRRRVVSFAVAIFAAAWIAVLGFGRHAVVTPTASAAGSPATSTSTITPSTSTGSSSADTGTSGDTSSQSGQSSPSADAPLTTSQS